MAFVKLDRGLLQSTTWLDKPVRDVFIAALLLAEPREYLGPVEEVTPGDTTVTGWCAPAGWYGYVPSSGPGLIHLAQIEPDKGQAALERLAAPDRSSRTKDFDGRRMIRVDGGYLILNYIKHRDRDHTSPTRSKRWRERQKRKREESAEVTSQAAPVTDGNVSTVTTRRDDTQADRREQREEGIADQSAHAAHPWQIPDSPPETWDAHWWLVKFKVAWEERSTVGAGRTPFYADTGDSKAVVTLSEELDKLPRDVRAAAQARAPHMFEEFLNSTDPRTIKRKYPFVFFVQEFGALRQSGVTKSEYPAL